MHTDCLTRDGYTDTTARTPPSPPWTITCRTEQFAAANSEELDVQIVPSLNLVYTEEEGYVTADVAEEKKLVRSLYCVFFCK